MEFLLGAGYAEASKLVSQGMKAPITPNVTPPGPSSTSRSPAKKTSVKVLTEFLAFVGRLETAAYDVGSAYVTIAGTKDDYPLLGRIVNSAGYFKTPSPHPKDLRERIESAMWMSHLLDQDYLKTTDQVYGREEAEWFTERSKIEPITTSPSSKDYPGRLGFDQEHRYTRTRHDRMYQDTGDTIDDHIDGVYKAVFPNHGNFFSRLKTLNQADLTKAERTLQQLAAL